MSKTFTTLKSGLDKANLEAAERILAEPAKYAGISLEWAEMIKAKEQESK